MRIVTRSIALAALAFLLPLSALAAHPASKTSAVFHVSSKFMHKASWMHVMGSAKLRYTKADTFVTITADNLPKASTLGKRVYVVFASDGAMTDKAGVLKATGNMATLKNAMLMMTKVADLYIYAEGSSSVKQPGKGIQVLSAMVG